MRSIDDRVEAAKRSLEGLTVGDAFGERFFFAAELIERRTLPNPPWGITDDSVMAISVVDVLVEKGHIEPDRLAQLFAARYRIDPARGYGGTAHEILARISSGVPWRSAAGEVFGGTGSMGNGGAMRAAPIGAFFGDDLGRVVEEARASALPTHAHPEGQAGAIAVAVAAAVLVQGAGPASLFETVLKHTPNGPTWDGIERASRLSLASHPKTAASVLGNGSRVIATDTVPFCLWCVARHAPSYEEALWATVSGLGDRDTTCAIVGGIVASAPNAQIPPAWQSARESLDCVALDRRQV